VEQPARLRIIDARNAVPALTSQLVAAELELVPAVRTIAVDEWSSLIDQFRGIDTRPVPVNMCDCAMFLPRPSILQLTSSLSTCGTG